MAKSKYTEETVQAICDAIALSGSDRAGYEAGGVGKDTFYRWLIQYSDFSDRVNQARSEYRDTCPEVLVRQANKAFADYLFGRMEKVVVTTERGTSLRTGEPYEREIVQRYPVGIPKWSLERVLGKPLDILEATKTFVEAGILPRWIVERVTEEIGDARRGIKEAFEGLLPEQNDFRAAKPGLSPQTAAAIRAHILGIEQSTTNTGNTGVNEVCSDSTQPTIEPGKE